MTMNHKLTLHSRVSEEEPVSLPQVAKLLANEAAEGFTQEPSIQVLGKASGKQVDVTC